MAIRVILGRALTPFALALPIHGITGQSAATPGCDSAATVVSNGQPRSMPEWALGTLTRCGRGGAKALAVGMSHYGADTDVATLDDYMTQVDNWRDEAVFEAAMKIATNPMASAQARVFAVRHLILLVQPNLLLTYAGMTKKADTTETPTMVIWQETGCVAQMISPPRGELAGSPLPADFETRVRSALATLARAPETPEVVRRASRCLLPGPTGRR